MDRLTVGKGARREHLTSLANERGNARHCRLTRAKERWNVQYFRYGTVRYGERTRDADPPLRATARPRGQLAQLAVTLQDWQLARA